MEGQFDLFTLMESTEEKAAQAAEKASSEREKRLQQATLKIQSKYGKNALLKGTSLQEGATTIERNRQIGGHRSGETGFTREKKVPKCPEK